MQNKPKRMGGRAGVGNRVREMLPELQIVRPNDMHVHFREGDMLQSVVPYTARQFCRAVVMPNTKIPILNPHFDRYFFFHIRIFFFF